MKFYLILIISTLCFLTSCWDKDSNLTKKIVGEWRIIEVIGQDLSKPDSKLDTINIGNNHVTWEFKSDRKSFVLNGSDATQKGTFDITDQIVSFDFESDFDLERMKVYELDDTNLILRRKVEDVEYVRMKFKKIKIE